MAKFEIKNVEDSRHSFFRVLKDGIISFQSDCEVACEEYILEEKRKNALALLEYNDFELSKLSVKYAENRDMGIGYDNCDYYPKEEREYHILNVYLDLDANDDGCIMYKVYEFKDDKFYGEFYASLYGREAEKIINEIMPKVIHGEKELRASLKVLEKHREEILGLSN
jgi:hypothetical protein